MALDPDVVDPDVRKQSTPRFGARRLRAASAIARPFLRAGQHVLLLAVVVFVWERATQAADSMYFPPPSDVFQRAHDLWLTGPANHLYLTSIAVHEVGPSVFRMLVGWVIGAVLGVVLGVAIGLGRVVRGYVEPALHFVRSLPAPALVPVFLLVFGLGSTMRISLIAFGVVWIVMINASQAVAAVDAQLLDTARAYQLTFVQRMTRVVLPASSPPIFAAMRVGLSLSLILSVLAEMLAGIGGIGGQLTQAQNSFALLDVWATMLLLGVLGIALNTAFHLFESRALAWHRGSRSGNN